MFNMRFFAVFLIISIASQMPIASAHAASTKCLPGVLKNALEHIGRRYGKVSVISTFRRGARIAGSGNLSKHASCRAVDFHVRGNKKGALAWLRKQRLEIITYGCGMHHVHIATGSYRGHHCVNSSGVRLKKRRR